MSEQHRRPRRVRPRRTGLPRPLLAVLPVGVLAGVLLLVDEALARYGDPAQAHRWVLPARTSAHVLGLAIDVGDTAGAFWLTEHGDTFGLCRRYQNEVWHFEKLPDGASRCPQPEADSSGGW